MQNHQRGNLHCCHQISTCSLCFCWSASLSIPNLNIPPSIWSLQWRGKIHPSTTIIITTEIIKIAIIIRQRKREVQPLLYMLGCGGVSFPLLASISSPLDWCEGWELSGGNMWICTGEFSVAPLLFPAHGKGTRAQLKNSPVLPSPKGDPPRAPLTREQPNERWDKVIFSAGKSCLNNQKGCSNRGVCQDVPALHTGGW